MDIIRYMLFGTAVIATGCFLLMVIWYWQNEKREAARARQNKLDIVDITIVFQTMRDIVSRQKTLAHQFNQEMEQKITLLNQVLAQSAEKNERLYEKQRGLRHELDEARAQLESLQRQIAYLEEHPNLPEGAAPEAPPEKPEAPPPRPPRIQAPSPTPRTAAQDTPQKRPEGKAPFNDPLAGTGLTNAPVSAWDPPELGPGPLEEEPYSDAPQSPEDAEAARGAFRALLSMEEQPSASHAGPSAEAARVTSSGAENSEARGGNGNTIQSAIQKRVTEYSEAGMSIGEISRELGIGKGEIRLMLSLAKQQKPPR